MRSDWSSSRIGEHVKIKHGFAFKGEYFQHEDNGVVVVTPGNFSIGGGFQSASRPKFYTGEAPPAYVLSPGQVIVTMTDLSKAADTLGYSAFVPADEAHRYLHNQRIGLVAERPGNAADVRFLAYVLRSQSYRDHILATASGSTVKHTSPSKIEEFEFLLPPIEEQHAIVGILDALGDRIANNRALATNLESIARAIFKSWFVDFDPVRAKMEGREPEGMDPEIAALFPDRLVESELGLVPDGWGVAPLSALANLDTSVAKPQAEPDSEFLHFSIPAFDGSGMPEQCFGRDIASNKYSVATEAVLVSKLNPSTWRCWRPIPRAKNLRAICSTEFMQFRPKGVSREWLWTLCESDMMRRAVLATVSGTTGSRQRAKPADVMKQSLLAPPPSIISAFTDVVSPLLDRADTAQLENPALRTLRDALLPRLISGRLRVVDTEEVVAGSPA